MCSEYMSVHYFNEVHVQLEEPPPPGTVQAGPRAFISLQNKFGEDVRSFIQSTQELIGKPCVDSIIIIMSVLALVVELLLICTVVVTAHEEYIEKELHVYV